MSHYNSNLGMWQCEDIGTLLLLVAYMDHCDLSVL